MRVLDLCSGVGMFSYGLEKAGFETIAFCEQDKICQKVLKKHWPDIDIYNDIGEIDGSIQADIITAGIPCQPYSRAGYRKGRADNRDLAQEVIRIVADIKPAWFILENVEGFIDAGLVPLLDDLEEIGYFTQTFSLPSVPFGLPTVERHIWVIATTDKKRCERLPDLTFSHLERLQMQFQGSDKRIPDRWHLPESRVCGVREGNAGRLDRIRQIGNSIPPQIPEMFGRIISENL